MILTTFVFLTVLACTLVCSSAFIHGPRFLRPRRQAFRRRRPVLILCSSECGCVTESGQTLICPFIEDTEALTILRANRLSRTTYRALRQITVGSFVITGASASSGTCPSSAGSPPPARGDRCFAAPRPARGEQAPVNGLNETLGVCNNEAEVSISVEQGDGLGSAALSFQSVVPFVSFDEEGNERRALGAASRRLGCRPRFL